MPRRALQPPAPASRTTGGSANGSIRSASTPQTSGVDVSRRPYPTEGTWERYAFTVGNIRFLMMSDRNDLPYPVGRQESGGGSPAGAVDRRDMGMVEEARRGRPRGG